MSISRVIHHSSYIISPILSILSFYRQAIRNSLFISFFLFRKKLSLQLEPFQGVSIILPLLCLRPVCVCARTFCVDSCLAKADLEHDARAAPLRRTQLEHIRTSSLEIDAASILLCPSTAFVIQHHENPAFTQHKITTNPALFFKRPESHLFGPLVGLNGLNSTG